MRGIVVVGGARDFVDDGNRHDFERYFVVEDYTVEIQLYYLFFDLRTDFDFLVDIDSHPFLVSGLVDVIVLSSEMDVNDLWSVIALSDRIEAQDFEYGTWCLILTFVGLV